MTDKTATIQLDNLPGFNGHAAWYRLSSSFRTLDENRSIDYIIVWTKMVDDGEKVFVYPSDINRSWLDNVLAEGDLNDVNHASAIGKLGYVLA